MDNQENKDPEVENTSAEGTKNVATETTVEVEPSDFNWKLGKKGQLNYDSERLTHFTHLYDETLSSVKEFEIVSGTVVEIKDGDVVLDLNYKSDGLVSSSEFRDNPDLKVGDQVEVYIETREDKKGQLVLSRRKAKLLRAWERIVNSYETGTVVTGHIMSKTKGGLIVDIDGLETFLPGSQIDIKPVVDYNSYVGKTMEFKVVKINHVIKNAVVSHKALIESDLEAQRTEIIAKLEKGQVLEGIVKNITDFGAFLDLGGVDGLLYITDISWGRIKHPKDVLENGQKLNVVVLDFNDDKKRISLGLKQLQPHPWDILPEDLQANSLIKGRVVNVEDYGAFLEVIPGVEGLIHISEVSWSSQPVNAKEFFKEGNTYEAKVVTINREDRKMSLSIKQLSEDPWLRIEEKYPKGSRHQGKVRNLTPYGVFMELEEGIGGMIHISDLSWTRRFNHPNEFTKVGADLEVIILDVDKEHRKLSLGHKHLEESPWDTFQSIFPVDSLHEATILRRDDRGAIVLLPYGLEAFAPIRHLRKEDGQLAQVDEQLTFKVLEFNRADKRILVSHKRYIDDLKKAEEEKAKADKRAERQKIREQIKSKNQQNKIEPSTLGNLGLLSELKDKLTKNKDDDAEE